MKARARAGIRTSSHFFIKYIIAQQELLVVSSDGLLDKRQVKSPLAQQRRLCIREEGCYRSGL